MKSKAVAAGVALELINQRARLRDRQRRRVMNLIALDEQGRQIQSPPIGDRVQSLHLRGGRPAGAVTRYGAAVRWCVAVGRGAVII